MFRLFIAMIAVFTIAGCENIDDLNATPKPIGEFALGHNVVVAPNLVMGPASREMPKDQWIEAMTKAIDDRFGRYEGDQLYHFGISLEGYVLAQPGLPVLLSPKSVLILKLTVWDDAAGKKLNGEPEQLTVLENLDGDTVVGSGLTKSPEEQMETLSINAAKLIQRWITRQHFKESWFKKRKGDVKPADEQVPAAAKDVETKKTESKAKEKDASVKPVDEEPAVAPEVEAAEATVSTPETSTLEQEVAEKKDTE